jgi:biopolymer transport protein ExbD
MPLKTESAEEPTMNLTPMIDVVLLLVIFFMVGTQFTEAEKQFDIDLPSVAAAQPLTGRPDELVVNITKDGAMYLETQPVTLAQLEQELQAAYERYEDQAVMVRGDAEVPYQAVMDVLGLCQQVNITNVQLANRLREVGAR